MLEDEGKEFTQWTLEELTALGKVAYRKRDNTWIPMLTDGTSLEEYVYKKDGSFGVKGTVFRPIGAMPMDFWGYALAYRLTDDEFMWEMARNIALGNGLVDIGATTESKSNLRIAGEHFDPYALLAFLELYRKTGETAFLQAAQEIGDNILASRFHKGFFVPSSKHIYAKFNAIEVLALLHLYATTRKKGLLVPQVWFGRSLFNYEFRDKEMVADNDLIYTLTESPEPPRSLQEAATCDDIKELKRLIAQGADVNGRESLFARTPLLRAVINGHMQAVELLVVEGANIDARSQSADTPLHFGVERGRTSIVELLISRGADVNARNAAGDTPMDIAVRRNHRGIVELLVASGAEVTIQTATYMGDLDKVKSFVEKGISVNVKDGAGSTPLHAAASSAS